MTILIETHHNVGVMRLNRPKELNALNAELLHALSEAVLAFDRDPAIGCLLITGSERAFAAGADIKMMAEASPVDMLNSTFLDTWDTVRRVRKPVVMAVAGHCLGGGLELALAGDVLVAADNARLGLPEITLGVMPGAGGTQRLTRAVGKALAMDLILTGRTFTAAEALQWGVVSRVFPVADYLEQALALAHSLAEKAPLALRLAKDSINTAFETHLAEGVLAERRNFYLLFASADQKEGMRAFIEKRKPNWTGQ